MYRVITVAREYGSGGSAIAMSVSQRLNWKLLDKELVTVLARTAQVDIETTRRCDEAVDSWWHRINRSGLLAAAIAAGATPDVAQPFDADRMAALTEKLIAEAAMKGDCVIVGRGGQCVLETCAEAFHVFVYAPWEQRFARVQERAAGHCDIGELLRSADRTSAAYIRRHFERNWKDPHLYHMMISSELGAEEVAAAIVGAVESREMAALSRSAGF
jgi:cytidylate kinase